MLFSLRTVVLRNVRIHKEKRRDTETLRKDSSKKAEVVRVRKSCWCKSIVVETTDYTTNLCPI